MAGRARPRPRPRRVHPAGPPNPDTAARAAGVPRGLRRAAGYAWRLLALGVVVYEAFTVLARFQLVAIALFLALILTALLRPLTDLIARWLPKPLAVTAAFLLSLLLLLSLFSLVGYTVAAQSGQLGDEFRGGADRIERWLEGAPFHVARHTLTSLRDKGVAYLQAHRSGLLSSALSGAGRVVDVVTGAALAVFCAIFFIHSGERMWLWFHRQLPARSQAGWDRAGRAAWHTFAGYTRGILIVSSTNAALVGVALFLLRVPLALPLTLLEFFAAFVPLIGSPIALAVATVVALAGRGVTTAALVLVLIVVIGELEGHVLHPLVMGWSVRLHPVVIAVSVIGGSVVGGVIGAVVAVPMVSVAWAVFEALRPRRDPAVSRRAAP
ncbi:AI-2E family transporter [Streptomyces sp. ICBB 8177]|uniref:AI-2E family transporter n=1 Tax=Streptomyces sp. ICBB 8177 TaxID=563922 RepID=UPI001F53EBBB|nr:AI-2E family transporter [Streptomyces sp. ICBB 8177]